jgi:flagellar basal-body rod protein FlgC
MNPLKAIMQQAVSGMQLESQRITVAAENISNVDTPGYKKKCSSSTRKAPRPINSRR